MSNNFLPLSLVAGAALIGPSWAAAQPMVPSHSDAAPSVIVLGGGTATKSAEWAIVNGTVRAQAKDQQTALRLLSAKQDSITDGLSRLAGTKAIKIEAGELGFTPILPANCRDRDEPGYGPAGPVRTPTSDPKCAPTGMEASVKLTATIHPADKVGDFASLAVQLGAEDVQMGESGVDDLAALDSEAARDAYDHALSQAKLLAAAAGEHLGRLVRLNRGGPDQAEPRYYAKNVSDTAVKLDLLRPPPPLIRPDVALKLTAPKVIASSWVVVEFELVK